MPPVVVPGTPVVPGIPVVPQPLHWRGFKKPVTGGLHAGAPFVLADVQGNLPIKFNWIEAGFNGRLSTIQTIIPEVDRT